MTQKFLGYRCSLCGSQYTQTEVQYTCPKDGGNLDIVLDHQALRRTLSPSDLRKSEDRSIWRYQPLLPVDFQPEKDSPIRSVGWTPLFSVPQLREELRLPYLWVKDESRNPTASFKDRASAVVVARAREIGARVVVTASTGNAGAALAGMAAAVGQPAVIFAPKTAPPAKIAQLLIFGAKVLLVDGTYDQAFDLTIQTADAFGWYCRNTGYNPFTLEGKKTAAFEIWEMLMSTQRPIDIFVSVGDGNIISGLHKGFKDLTALNWIEQMPRIFGVQADGSAAIANAFHAGSEVIRPVAARTIADSISVDLPRDGVRAVRAARETGGTYVTVSDEEILAAMGILGKAGIFAEPAGATSFAGLLKARDKGLINPDANIVVLNTGSGLKDVQTALRSVPAAPVIEPTLTRVTQALEGVVL